MFLPAGKAFVAKKPAEIPEHEQVILEPELEEALKNATDAEMCDIAGSVALWSNCSISLSQISVTLPWGLRSDYRLAL